MCYEYSRQSAFASLLMRYSKRETNYFRCCSSRGFPDMYTVTYFRQSIVKPSANFVTRRMKLQIKYATYNDIIVV